MNNREVKKEGFLKYSRKASLLRGRSAYQVIVLIAVLGFVGHSIAYSVLNDKWNGNNSYRTSAYKVTSTSYNRDSLLPQINRGKSRLKEMEAQLQIMSSSLDNLSKSIEVLKTEIEGYENAAATGKYVSQSSYDKAINSHNKFVEQYSSVYEQYQTKYSAYESELERVNNMVDRYNRGY